VYAEEVIQIKKASDISSQESRDRIKSSIQKYYTLATYSLPTQELALRRFAPQR